MLPSTAFALIAVAADAAAAAAAAASSGVEPPKVELVTIGPSDGLEEPWGASALRVYDPKDGADFGYELEGATTRRPFQELLARYAAQNRTITRRYLNLGPAGAESLAGRLSQAVKERRPSAERSIALPHAGDASAKIADELDRASGGALKHADHQLPGTLRTHLLRPIRGRTLAYVALDVMLAKDVDRPISAFEASILPEGLAALTATITQGEYDAYRSTQADEDATPWTWPWTKIYMFFVAPFVALAFYRPKLATKIYGGLSELGGIGLVLLWIDGRLPWFSANWNIATFSPLLIASLLDRGGALKRGYLWFRLAVLAGLSVSAATNLIHQSIGGPVGAFLPMTLSLIAAEERARRR